MRLGAKRVNSESGARGGSEAEQLAPEIHRKHRADSKRSSWAAAHKVIVATRPVGEKQREVDDPHAFGRGGGGGSALEEPGAAGVAIARVRGLELNPTTLVKLLDGAVNVHLRVRETGRLGGGPEVLVRQHVM